MAFEEFTPDWTNVTKSFARSTEANPNSGAAGADNQPGLSQRDLLLQPEEHVAGRRTDNDEFVGAIVGDGFGWRDPVCPGPAGALRCT
jgi:hypothetical protein